MIASELLIQKFVEKMCPALPSLLASMGGTKPVFIVQKVPDCASPMSRVFLRSDVATTWSSHPKFSEILAACTPAGRTWLERVTTARTESIFASGDSLVTGPENNAQALFHNNAIPGGTMKSRLMASAAKIGFTIPDTSLPLNSTPFDVQFRSLLGNLGFTDLSEWSVGVEPFGSAIGATILAAGPGRVAFSVGTNYVNGIAKNYYVMHAKGFDSSFKLWKATSSGSLASYLSSPSYYVGIDDGPLELPPLQSQPLNVQNLAAFQSYLNPNIPAYTGAWNSDLTLLLTSKKIDWSWLPLIATPRDQELYVRSDFSDVAANHIVGTDYDIMELTFSTSTLLGAVPVQWYIDYVDEKVANGAVNSKELKAGAASMAENVDKVITFCELPSPVMLPADIVKLTTTYADYKKAREKACEENDYMSLPFADTITFGTVNTTINGSRNTKVFYGYREDSPVATLEGADALQYVGYSLTLGSATVTVRNAEGRFETPITGEGEGPGMLASYIAAGASVSGGTYDSQLAIWGLSASSAAAAIEGLNELTARTVSSEQYGTSSAVHDFRWGSLGISGFPDYTSVDAQTSYRMAMVSKILLGSIGKKLMALQSEENSDAFNALLFS